MSEHHSELLDALERTGWGDRMEALGLKPRRVSRLNPSGHVRLEFERVPVTDDAPADGPLVVEIEQHGNEGDPRFEVTVSRKQDFQDVRAAVEWIERLDSDR